jgi:hypothetical protein
MPGHSLAFYPGQRVEGSGGLITQELPPGGATGELLAKSSPADGAVEWVPPVAAPPVSQLVPITSGANGDVLTKISPTLSGFQPLAAGGNVNDVLVRTATGQAWRLPTDLNAGGNAGQIWTCLAPGIGGWRDPVLVAEEPEARIAGPSYEEFDALKDRIAELEHKLSTLSPRRRST